MVILIQFIKQIKINFFYYNQQYIVIKIINNIKIVIILKI